MRRLVLLLCLAPLVAHSQTGQIFGNVSSGIRLTRLYQPVATRPITDLQGFPKPPEDAGVLPLPITDANSPLLVIDRVGDLNRMGDQISATGPIEMDYRGYKIFADQMEGNMKTEVFTFKGHVQILGDTGQVKGSTVEVEFKTRFFRATRSDSILKASATQGYLVEDLFFDSEESIGTPAEQFHIDSTATTCDYPTPHFEIRSKFADVRPRKRAILKYVDLIILKKKVLHLPILVIPLDRPPDRYIPEFGEDPQEGYFVKSKWGVDSHIPNSDLLLRLDYMSKLGNGFGFDLGYGNGPQHNTLSVYTVPFGPQTTLITNHHDQFWGRSEFSLDNQFQKNNFFYADNSTYWTSAEAISIPQKTGNTRLTYNLNDTTGDGFQSTQTGFGLEDDRHFGITSESLTMNYSSYGTTSDGQTAVSTQQIDVNFMTQTQLKKAEADFQYQRSIPIGQTSGFFSSSDQTPVLTLRSDARRLANGKFADAWPFTVDASVGQFQDPIFGGEVEREYFDVGLNKTLTAKGRFNSSVTSQFQQGFYSDNTAQFTLAYGNQSSYNFAKNSTWNFQYNYERPQGYSPLAIDQTGRTDYATSDISYQVLRPLSLGIQTAYDFTAAINPYGGPPWQQLGIRSDYLPNDKFSFRTSASYDTYNQSWGTFRSDIEYKYNTLYAAAGILYDAERAVWGDLNFYLSGFHVGKTGFEARVEYNGYSENFQALQLGVVYDLHDAEAVFQVVNSQYGLFPGTSYNFFIRLKALPFNSLFGTGSQGQPIGTGTGRSF